MVENKDKLILLNNFNQYGNKVIPNNNAEFDYFINIEDVNLRYSENDFNAFGLRLNNLGNFRSGNYWI